MCTLLACRLGPFRYYTIMWTGFVPTTLSDDLHLHVGSQKAKEMLTLRGFGSRCLLIPTYCIIAGSIEVADAVRRRASLFVGLCLRKCAS
jgi:hypothetical protein